MPSLTRDEAVSRAELLHITEYEVDLDLIEGVASPVFTATTTIHFDATTPGAATFVELRPASIVEVRLNATPLDPAALVDNRFPLEALEEHNELVVRATMRYSNSGEGLHRFTDPEDGEVYLYAQAALDDAQRVFACFDQPDLKAPVRLRVSAPETWSVWSNGAGTRVAPGRWEFAATPPVSTYLITVVAGNYHARYAEHDGITLGLLCRRSLASHLDRDTDEILEVTRACFDRYHELFGIRYPFGKYDQAFVPQFNAGAMENPGCVTFRDEFIFRSGVTETQRELRAVVIAHEMAHMWFGDLVTMRWWDDLWLNESFAELMGWWVTAEATRFDQAWASFTIGRKGTGYAADQRPSTHPIAAAGVANTALALLNLDGISYAKGASVLRQLVAWLGEDVFLAGLRDYLTTHAYGNATLADLLSALSQASGRDLTSWAEVWLRRPQVNTLRPEVTLDPDGRYAEVAIVQTAPVAYPTLRPHRVALAVYGGDGAAVAQIRTEVDLDPWSDGGRTRVSALTGVAPARLLLLNDGDLTFAKVRFDDASRAALPEVLPALADPLARALTWSAAADATRDAELSGVEFVALAAAGLVTESKVSVFEEILRFAAGTVVHRFLEPAARPAALALLAAACVTTLDRAEPGGGWQLAAARALAMCAVPASAPLLTGWLDGVDVPDGLLIDTELRWLVFYRLVILGQAGEAEIAAELRRDPTGQGTEHAARCRAALPDTDAKARAWATVVQDDNGSARLLAATADGFWQPEQEELTAGYVPRYFVDLPAIASRRSAMSLLHVASFGYPRFAVSADTVTAAEALLTRDDLDPMLRRVVVDATDELRRALAARAFG